MRTGQRDLDSLIRINMYGSTSCAAFWCCVVFFFPSLNLANASEVSITKILPHNCKWQPCKDCIKNLMLSKQWPGRHTPSKPPKIIEMACLWRLDQDTSTGDRAVPQCLEARQRSTKKKLKVWMCCYGRGAGVHVCD